MWPRAVLADGAVTDGLPAGVGVERFRLLAEVEWDDGRTALSTEYLERALEAAAGDRKRSAAILTRLVLVGVPADPARALDHAEQAMRLLSEDREPQLVSSILIDRFSAGVLLGRGARTELLDRGLALEARAGPAAYPSPVPLIWFQCIDDVEATIARHEREDTWARERGDDRMRAERVGYLALVHMHAGRWDLAEQLVERSCDTLAELDVSGRFAYAFAWRSQIDAYRGRFDRALSTLTPLVEEADRTETAWWEAILLSVLGFVEFSAGNHEAAESALTRMSELLDGIGIRDAFLERTEPFHAVESLVALGKLASAARYSHTSRSAGGRTRDCGSTSPSRGPGRSSSPQTAIRKRRSVPSPESTRDGGPVAVRARPRRRCCAAAAVRRLKQRRLAADAFQEALTGFEHLGAPTWVDAARSELARVGPRRRAQHELTATELRVAELAATGLTNREVAQTSFMSAKTVEAHLASVYRKLGIHSRAQLGAHLEALTNAETSIT
jgi:DNA-binding CsgD family transcriptional regulator